MVNHETTIEIVRATIDDLPLLVPLFDGYRQFYQQPSNLEAAELFLFSHLEHHTSVIFLAFSINAQEQKLAGGFTQLYPSFSSVSMKPLWILNDLFVAPEARRSGIGRALLERARTFAAETGAKGLTLTTALNNVTAQSVYEAAGWKRDQEFCTYTLYF